MPQSQTAIKGLGFWAQQTHELEHAGLQSCSTPYIGPRFSFMIAGAFLVFMVEAITVATADKGEDDNEDDDKDRETPLP